MISIRAELDHLQKEYIELPEDTQDEVFDEIESKIKELELQESKELDALWDSKIPELKPSEWYKKFLDSFKPCNKKWVSFKQCTSLDRILIHSSTNKNYNSFYSTTYASCERFHGKYEGYIYELSEFSNGGYLTKRKIEGGNKMEKIEEVVKYVIETGLKSTTYGNWFFSWGEILEETGFVITSENENKFIELLSKNECVADVSIWEDDTIDITFYTDYIPNYAEEEEN